MIRCPAGIRCRYPQDPTPIWTCLDRAWRSLNRSCTRLRKPRLNFDWPAAFPVGPLPGASPFKDPSNVTKARGSRPTDEHLARAPGYARQGDCAPCSLAAVVSPRFAASFFMAALAHACSPRSCSVRWCPHSSRPTSLWWRLLTVVIPTVAISFFVDAACPVIPLRYMAYGITVYPFFGLQVQRGRASPTSGMLRHFRAVVRARTLLFALLFCCDFVAFREP